MANDSYGVKRKSASIAVASGTTGTASLALNGELWQVNTITPALTSGTATLKLTDADGGVVWTGTATAASTVQVDKLTSPVLLSGAYTLTVTYSVSQTSMTTSGTLIIRTV